MSVVRADLPSEVGASERVSTGLWPPVAAVLLCVLVPLAVFAPTFSDMVGTWWRSEVFTHCFLVLPAFAYLLWDQREDLAATPLRPAPLGLIGVLGFAFLIALGELSASLTPSFFGLIGVSVFTVVAVLGWRLASRIWVPLLFLFFAVPFGEVFVPRMIDWTADFTVMALRASGVPVFREGPNFVIPSGAWSVVDACSGIRYLLASMFAGCLYAWLMYRSTTRRLLFMAAAIVVPIVANWFRAYLIVMLGHLSQNRIATGVDHIIYGWVFFGVILGLLFWIGAFFREDGKRPTHSRATASSRDSALAGGGWQRLLPMGGAAFALMALSQVAISVLADRSDPRTLVVRPIQPANGWSVVTDELPVWTPALRAPAATLKQTFSKDGQRVEVYVAYYRNQSQESELVNSSNDLTSLLPRPWAFISEATESTVLGPVDSMLARRPPRSLVVWKWYWIDGKVTTSDAEAKARLALSRLLFRGDTSAWVAIHASDEEDGRQARASLAEFSKDMGPAINAAIAEVGR